MLMNNKHRWICFLLSLSMLGAAAFYSMQVQAADKTKQPVSLSNLYNNRDSHYSIKYPANWIYDASEKGAVVFSGKKDTPSYYSTVNIQTILTKKFGGDYANLDQFIADIKKQTLQESPNASFIDSGTMTLKEPDGSQVEGRHLTFIYSYKDQLFEQWQIVVLRNDGQVFYTFAYTSPVDQYQTDLGIAQAMLKTWSIYK
jgi:hypothetical protein